MENQSRTFKEMAKLTRESIKERVDAEAKRKRKQEIINLTTTTA